ncbi:hypothetical protein E4T47_06412 [Aureobasidium subglaciale]|nr:hypothetical protein E4T43_01934 [Aureobasidium subglaciale]KAI5270156.1 hypothetical protein E4T47_06412 [Aureobasidium subglaciale]
MVGKEGMPEPAPRPKGPKLKFTREDDALLVRLKETKNITWKQISEFFPGRSAGTLQVRYCTKLKAKTTLWNDDMFLEYTSEKSGSYNLPRSTWELRTTLEISTIEFPAASSRFKHIVSSWSILIATTQIVLGSGPIQRLRTAIHDYDNDRWRFISSKVGSGFSATACKAKAEEIEAEDMREEEGAASDSEDDQQNTVDGDVEEQNADGEGET